MCGIVGIQSTQPVRAPDEGVLRAMTASLVHRGPDDEGYETHGGTALGFRRLSIIDIAGGHQPLSNEDTDRTGANAAANGVSIARTQPKKPSGVALPITWRPRAFG